jgi:S1-C subfamily serine protease
MSTAPQLWFSITLWNRVRRVKQKVRGSLQPMRDLGLAPRGFVLLFNEKPDMCRAIVFTDPHMKRHLRYLVPALICLSLNAGSASGEWPVSQIAREFTPSVVSVTALDEEDRPLSYGSGFFVNSRGDLVTSHHVLAGSAKAKIRTSSGDEGEVLEILKDEPALDLVWVRTSLRQTPPLPLGDSDRVRVGDEVLIIGNPAALEGFISLGSVSAVLRTKGLQLIQTTAPILRGSSGGPVMNTEGKVVGVATAFLEMGRTLSFAMPVNYLNDLRPTRLKLSDLPRTTIKLDALIRDKASVEAVDIYYQTHEGRREKKRSLSPAAGEGKTVR